MEKVILIGAITKTEDELNSNEHLEELRLLSFTAGGKVIKVFQQKINRINSKTFLGKGKVYIMSDFIKSNKIDTAIFDDELSPSQQKNLEQILACKVVDRTNLILSIFAMRAQTAIAKIQVELALDIENSA